MNLLRVAVEDSLDVGIRQVAAITFKNATRKDWEPLGGLLLHPLISLAWATAAPKQAATRHLLLMQCLCAHSAPAQASTSEGQPSARPTRGEISWKQQLGPQFIACDTLQRGQALSLTVTRRLSGTICWRAS